MFNWLSILAGIFYIILGVLVFWHKFFVVFLDPTVAYFFGCVLVLYGFFRIARGIYRIRKF
ncbi:MAG: C4-dicarboxylate ABC transporter [Bergeyella sp.]|nr:C4-dicarboxylate ABC transporter [Bergeyella sp.]